MPAGYTAKQGDAGPPLSDQFTYPDGSLVDLTGANVSLVMRSLRSAFPVPITGEFGC